jgi:hypothetical protein
MMTIFKTFNTKTKEVKEYSKPEFGDFGEFVIIRDAGLEYLGESLAECQLHEDNQCYRQDNRELKYNELIGGDNITAVRFFKNTDHELNTLFNSLFKDCVYGNGDLVGVLQKAIIIKESRCHKVNKYTIGSVFFDKDTDYGCSENERSFVYTVLKYGEYYDYDAGYRNGCFGFYFEYRDKHNYKDYIECINDDNYGIKNSPYKSIDNLKKNHFKKTNPSPVIKKRPFSGKIDCCDLTVYTEGHSVYQGNLLDEYFAGGNELVKTIYL